MLTLTLISLGAPRQGKRSEGLPLLVFWSKMCAQSARSNPDRLCRYCEKLEFSLLNQREDKTYILPPKEEIWANSSCPVCRLLRQAIGEALPDNGPEIHATWTRDGGFRIPMSCTLVFLDETGFAKSARGMGCYVQHAIDPGLVNKWIRLCESHHGEACTHAPNVVATAENPAGMKVFRMIDVQNQCIVEVGPGCRYVALSYMWGQVETVKLLSQNKAQLMAHGGLLAFRYRLPRTINDAIDLLCAMGEQYLWVDSICLLQDDHAEMRDAIGKMHLVYRGAILTILAGAGRDANAGLPGVRFDSRVERAGQYIEEVQPGIRMTVVKPLAGFLNLSTHITRGWTMQEHVLSHRLLIFTGDLVFFKCHQNCWSEDTIYDVFPEETSEPLLVRSAAIDIPLIGDSDSDPIPFFTYSSIILTYSSRVLTKESDTLDAAAGILNFMSLRLKCDMLAGLPTGAFDLAILFFDPWIDNKTDVRRKGFPSWSWAGWTTCSIMMKGARPPPPAEISHWLRTQTYIVWHKRDLLTGELSLVWDVREGLSEGDVAYSTLGRGSTIPYGRAESTRSIGFNTAPLSAVDGIQIPHEYPLLQFWAYTVEFGALEHPDVQEYSSYERTDRIRGPNGELCGGIRANDPKLLHGAGGRYECILLSKAEGHANEFNDAFFWESLGKPIWWVMLIAWDGLVAERRGLGFIYEDCMEYMTPRRWKEILLA